MNLIQINDMTSNQIKRPLGLQSLIYGFVLLWFILAVFPFFWTMWGSFKVELDFFSKGDWKHAISGVRTQAVYGESFTGAGYEGAWTVSYTHLTMPTIYSV